MKRRKKSTHVPTFSNLERTACEALLARNSVGRIAYAFHNRVDIQPINYVYVGEWLYGRTSPGTKLEVLKHQPWVAFEVDEVEAQFEWKSVVVRGGFYTFSHDGPETEARSWEQAIDHLRTLLPETWTGADPVAFRNVVFGIHVDEMTGRMATLGGSAAPVPFTSP